VGRREKAKQPGRGGSIKFCSNARFVGEEEREREITRPGAERRAAPACLTGRRGSRSGRLPNVEERGTASEGNAGGGRRDRAMRGARRKAAGARGWPAAGATRARRGAEEIGGSGETMGDPVAKSRKPRGLIVMYR
jgi:hypothetical protein